MKDKVKDIPYPKMEDIEKEYVEEMKEMPMAGVFKMVVGTKILKAMLEKFRAKKNHHKRDKSLDKDLVYTL